MSERVPIQEKCTLPSMGKLYNGIVPEEITLRAMTALEEKLRLSSFGFDVIPKLINTCAVDAPAGFDAINLKTFDLQFLMYRLRVVTYGADYETSVICPHCGAVKNITVNLDNIPVKYMEEVPNTTIGPLPVSGDVIVCNILSARDHDYIEKESARILDKFPDFVGNPEYILGLMARIDTVNGVKLEGGILKAYVEKMHMKDVRHFEQRYDEIVGGVGMDLRQDEVCGSCGKNIEFYLSTNSEFFRPRC